MPYMKQIWIVYLLHGYERLVCHIASTSKKANVFIKENPIKKKPKGYPILQDSYDVEVWWIDEIMGN